MKSTALLATVAALADSVAGHAIFQQLWVDGKDMISSLAFLGQLPCSALTLLYGSTCNRLPRSNSPVSAVNSADVVCNAGGRTGVAGKCPVPAGGTVTVEMHQQPGDRNCRNEALGGAHYGPVLVYLSKVADAATADGAAGQWFKIFEDGWAAGSGAVGDNDNWGTKDLNTCCGRMDVPIPATLPDGDYLLRAEAIALHTAGQSGGAQLYMSCYQITIAGSNATALPTVEGGVQMVKFPGAYSARDPGILINIHATVKSYTVPGPAVMAGGTTKTAGSGCAAGCAKTCSVAAAAGAKSAKTVSEPTTVVARDVVEDEPEGEWKRGVAFRG